MNAGLARDEVKRYLDQVEAGLPSNECSTCDCFQGFLAQLELDAVEDVSDLTRRFKVPRAQMHGCLGCEPCPPGSMFADYLRRQGGAGGGCFGC
jgi:hypothetical protein